MKRPFEQGVVCRREDGGGPRLYWLSFAMADVAGQAFEILLAGLDEQRRSSDCGSFGTYSSTVVFSCVSSGSNLVSDGDRDRAIVSWPSNVRWPS